MAKVWKKLQRADSDFAGNVTGQVGGTSASDVKDGAVAGSAAKTITDAAFDSNTKLKTANASDGLLNSQVTVAKDSNGNISLNNAGYRVYSSKEICDTWVYSIDTVEDDYFENDKRIKWQQKYGMWRMEKKHFGFK